MKWFDDWVLKKASNINAKKEEESKKQNKNYEQYIKNKDRILKILISFLDEKIISMGAADCHIQIGDTCIFNIYQLGRKCDNGWDNGPSAYINIVKNKKTIATPILIKIESIKVDSSLALQRIDKFISDKYCNEKDIVALDNASNDDIINRYKLWLLRNYSNTSSIFDLFGLYKSATFISPLEFKPKWGLNINSFLATGTQEYRDTYILWKKEISIKKRLEEVTSMEREFKSQKKNIFRKYE